MPPTTPARARKKEPKNLISSDPHQHRSAESSPDGIVIQAQGFTIGPKQPTSRPLSVINNSSSPDASLQKSSVSRSWARRLRPFDEKHEPSKSVAVPAAAATAHSDITSLRSCLTPSAASSSTQDMSYRMTRPPRLPLPIEEERHKPVLLMKASADIGDHTDGSEDKHKDSQSGLPRKVSGLNDAAGDDDAEKLLVDKTRPAVPTGIERSRGGHMVHNTGTPLPWSHKQRLLPAEDRDGILETTMVVSSGTHYLGFQVDGAVKTSTDLPNAVNFGDNLVHCIKVSGGGAAPGSFSLVSMSPKTEKDVDALQSAQLSELDEQHKSPQKKAIAAAETFSSRFPQYLSDFDQPEDTRTYQLSVGALGKLPAPPSLPGFLSKPILIHNPINDDNSVLKMPNHTVLNHVATSSIKNNVLAISATTRYRNKYVTTIIYKPAAEDS